MKMTRREVCAAAAAAQAMVFLPSFADAAGGGKKRWYRGNMHCHAYWSDGRAFPDQAITRCDADYQRHMHMNYINLDAPIPEIEKAWLIQGMPRGWSESQIVRHYVRARIESDELAPYYAFGGKGAMHPKVAMAWTQSYRRG